MAARADDRDTVADRSAEARTRFRLFARPLRGDEARLLALYYARAFLTLIDSDRGHFESWLPWARQIRSARGLGFAEEGLLREHVILDGTARDLMVYGMLRRDWRERQPAR